MEYAVIIIGMIGYALIGVPYLIDQKTLPLREEVQFLRKELNALRKKFDALETGRSTSTAPAATAPAPPVVQDIAQSNPSKWTIGEKELVPPSAPTPSLSSPVPPTSFYTADSIEDAAAWEEEEARFPTHTKPSPKPTSKTSHQTPPSNTTSEWNIGAKLPVWIGSVSLILAAVFLVKYSIDAGWLSPAVRVIMGLLFGGTLIATGYKLFEKPSIPNYIRVSQGLVGAGIVALYAGLYAATSVYHFVPPMAGFLGMTLVTITAIILSVRHGTPIAIFGLIGGMLTPALVNTGTPNPHGLFSYLFMMTGGMTFMMVRRQWWTLAFLPVIGSFIWAIFWIMSGFAAGSEEVMALFAVGTMGSILFATSGFFSPASIEEDDHPKSLLNIAGLAGTAIIFILIENQLELGLFELAMSGLISAAVLALAWLRPGIYRWVVGAKCLLDLGMVGIWIDSSSLTDGIYAVTGLATIYGLAPQFLMNHSKDPRPWAILQAASTFVIFIMSYLLLDIDHSSINVTGWALVALLLASLAANKVSIWSASKEMVTTYAVATISFLSCGVTIQLDAEWLPLAFALQTLGVVWIAQKIGIDALNNIIKLSMAVFVTSLLGQVVLFVTTITSSLVGETPHLLVEYELAYPLFQLGGPLLVLLAASYLSLRHKGVSDGIVKILVSMTAALAAATTYYLVRGAFVGYGESIFNKQASFWERGAITLCMIVAAECLRVISHRFSHIGLGRFDLAYIGNIVLQIALARIVYFDLIVFNPYFHASQTVGSLPILNAVTLVYGAGLIASLRAIRIHAMYKTISGILLFSLVTLTVRQLFHGDHLHAIQPMQHAEFYSYSIMWLVTGLGLLTYGIMRNNKSARIAALGFLLLTIGKVFIFDASVLEGLMRVFSFLGLGVSLIGLSMVYTRFMNTKNTTETE